MRLGIRVERIEPGHPEQNGRHERMHRTLKAETTKPPGSNYLQQQEKFDYFRNEYNQNRPHEALSMKTPAEVYKPSNRLYPKQLSEPDYPLHDYSRKVTQCGSIRLKNGHRLFISEALADQFIGLREEDDGIWKVSFMNLDLGFCEENSSRLTPTKDI